MKMVKAVFINYTDMMVQDLGQDHEELIARMVKNCSLKEPVELFEWINEQQTLLREQSYGENYQSVDDHYLIILEKARISCGLKENYEELRKLWINHWMYGPMYNDVFTFFKQCHVPVYIVSELPEPFIRVNLKRNDLHVHGILSSDAVKAYRPRNEIYDKAIQMCECKSEDILWVTGSYENDGKYASLIGMTPILLKRYGKEENVSCKEVNRLNDVLRYIE
ncbi:MAG: HAD family hydrolase [Solobacterium sp.]|nr:HAD family hydrolase [Solobacterium sp.]